MSQKLKSLPLEYLTGVLIISFMILLCLVLSAHANILVFDGEPYKPLTIDNYVDAIYWAEGGKDTNFPYGIKSVSCNGEKECRRICKNTVRNNIKRYNKWGHEKYADFLSFLASRYCPVKGDKTGLNKNWISNVRWFLEHPKGVK